MKSVPQIVKLVPNNLQFVKPVGKDLIFLTKHVCQNVKMVTTKIKIYVNLATPYVEHVQGVKLIIVYLAIRLYN